MKEKKSRQLYAKSALVRCTEQELKKLHEKAEDADESLSRFLVKSGLSDDKIPNKETKEEIRLLRFELRKIGVNLNQIAYAMNTSRHSSNSNDSIDNEIKSVSKGVESVIAKLLKLL
jgi:capsule polysaccharide export protein KpsE/RkpR